MHTERFKGEPRRFGRDAACNVSISRRRFYNPDIRKIRRGFFIEYTLKSYKDKIGESCRLLSTARMLDITLE